METRHLRFIEVAAECGSINTAAERLNLTQPALSKIIARIEDEFRVKLFERSARGITISRYGELFIKRPSAVTA